MKVPDFICVGAQKAGTTTLHDVLKQHPDIYLPELKEAHFFDINERYKKGVEWWVSTFFSGYSNEKTVGVMTPEYLFYAEVPCRIEETLGSKTKIIIVLRNPVDRAYSHYLMSVRRGFEPLSFTDAIESEHERIQLGEFERNNFSYISRGFYAKQVRRYLKIFGRENVLILSFENGIKKNINISIKQIEEFLGVSKIELYSKKKSNPASQPKFAWVNDFIYKSGKLKRYIKKLIGTPTWIIRVSKKLDDLNQKPTQNKQLDPVLRKVILNKYFKNDIQELEQLLGISLTHWNE
jgi:hypothetical protein